MKNNLYFFNNEEDYLNKRNKMYNNIKKNIIECIINNKKEFDAMKYQGLTSGQDLAISFLLTKELKKLTENKCDNWCEEITFNIMIGINSFLDGLVKIKRMNNFTSEEIANLIYNSILYQLDNDEIDPYLLYDIKIYKNKLEEIK